MSGVNESGLDPEIAGQWADDKRDSMDARILAYFQARPATLIWAEGLYGEFGVASVGSIDRLIRAGKLERLAMDKSKVYLVPEAE